MHFIDIRSYKGLVVILDAPFDEPFHDPIENPILDPIPINPPLVHKEHIDAILYKQMVFTRNRGAQPYLVNWKG